MSGTTSGTPITIASLASQVATAITGSAYTGVNVGASNVTPTDTAATGTINNAIAGRVNKSGDTMTGLLTLSGTGTGFSVTNNATVGGLLTANASGTSIQTYGNIRLGAGVATGADVSLTTVNNSNINLAPGTGAMVKASGTLRAGHMSVRADLAGGTSWASGTASEGVSNAFVAGGVSGTAASGSVAAINYFAIASDTLAASAAAGTFASGFQVAHNFGGAAMTGSRNVVNALGNLTASSGNTSGVGGSYCAGQFTMQAQVNDGGTALTQSGARGFVYGGNSVAALTASGATFFQQVVGHEIDVYAVAGTSTLDKIGGQIVQTSADAVSGTRDDVAFTINNQSGAVGWQYGLEFGRNGGTFPVKSTGTLIYGQGNLGTGFTVANGIDWSLGTFTGSVLKSNGFALDGSGNVAMAKAGFNGTSPVTKPVVTGSRGGNAALASLITALAGYGLITDSTSA